MRHHLLAFDLPALILLVALLPAPACVNVPNDDDATGDDDDTTIANDDDSGPDDDDTTVANDDDSAPDDDDDTPDPCAGEPPVCEGICALYPPTCTETGWLCSAPGMEVVEESCDGFDNDCDGEVDEGVCPDCTFDLAAQTASLNSIWDIDFDFDCNTYLTSMVSGADWAKVVPEDPSLPTATYYGNANQNMGWALVDSDPNNRRVVVTYSCCAGCGCQAQNGVTLLYTCQPTDPGCGCAGQSQCPGFLDAPFLAAGYEDLDTTFNGLFMTTPNGLAAGPRSSYFLGNFRPAACSTDPACVACDPSHPGVFCPADGSGCCDTTAKGRLARFTLPSPGTPATFRIEAILPGEVILGLASGRDGSVLAGTDLGNVYRFDPVANSTTLLTTLPGAVFSITQERPTGDWYLELRADPKIVRLSEAGLPLTLPATVPPAPPEEAVLQWGPDGQLYRLRGKAGANATLEVYPL